MNSDTSGGLDGLFAKPGFKSRHDSSIVRSGMSITLSWDRLADAYFEAATMAFTNASQIKKYLDEKGREQDLTPFYPALLLTRHTLELRLKAVISRRVNVTRKQRNTHDLKKLWNIVKSMIEPVGDEAEDNLISEAAGRWIEFLVSIENDPDGLRYPSPKNWNEYFLKDQPGPWGEFDATTFLQAFRSLNAMFEWDKEKFEFDQASDYVSQHGIGD